MTDQEEPIAGHAEFDDAEVVRVAALLDQVSSETSRHRRHVLAREVLLNADSDSSGTDSSGTAGAEAEAGLDDDDVDEFDLLSEALETLDDPDQVKAATLSPLTQAAWAAMRYHVEITGEPGKERARMEPDFRGPDGYEPPETDAIDASTRPAWQLLANAVTLPGARAQLNHLAFQAGVTEARTHAQNAIDAYLKLAGSDSRQSDVVHSARVAVRLSRAVGDNARHAAAIEVLKSKLTTSLDRSKPSVGAVKDAFRTLIGEDAEGTRELVEKACAVWPAGNVADTILGVLLTVASNDEERNQIWDRRVQNYVDMAESSDSNVMRATRLRQALELAELSGIKTLRERAAVLVQGIRNLDLEMMRTSAASHQYDEQVEEVIASILLDATAAEVTAPTGINKDETSGESSSAAHPTWYRRLLAFANTPAPTGDPEANRELIEMRQRLAPLQAYFPMHLQTPEGLPLYAPATREDRFELDMVTWEAQLLQTWTPFFAEALHRVIDPDIPNGADLARALDAPPAADTSTARQLAAAFERYWTGDGEAAAFTALPIIEALVRSAVLAADRGVYRLQKNQQPGQYVGLGILLDLFYGSYDVPERDQRFLNALLRHPGGWNLRNLAMHGYLPAISGSVAAIVLYAALRVTLIASNGPAFDDEGDHEGNDVNDESSDGSEA